MAIATQPVYTVLRTISIILCGIDFLTALMMLLNTTKWSVSNGQASQAQLADGILTLHSLSNSRISDNWHYTLWHELNRGNPGRHLIRELEQECRVGFEQLTGRQTGSLMTSCLVIHMAKTTKQGGQTDISQPS
jgi:hypothetical protein